MSATTPAPRPGRGVLAVLALVVAALAVAAAVEATAAPADAPPAAQPAVVPAPTAGAWYCPVTAGADDTAVLTVAAVGAETATVTVDRHEADGVRSEDPVALAAGETTEVVLDDGEARWPSTVRWSGGPVAVTWRVEGPEVAGAPCETGPSPRVSIAGLDTSAASTSTLHLLNPFATDAVVRVTFGTPTGPVALVLTDNVLVPAGEGLDLDLGEYAPQEADLAAHVEVLSGRVVAQGAVALAPTEDQPGPTGRAVLRGTAEPGLEWAMPFARDDARSTSWVALHNPGEREAAVEVQVAQPAAESSALLGEVSVPAGGTARVDLTGASELGEFGVVVESLNEVPVVAARLTAVQTAAGAEGVAAARGEQPGPRWALVGGGAGDRQSRVVLHNPGGQAVTVRVDAGPGTPAAWEDVALEPNAFAALELAEAGDAEAITVLVEADGPVAADVRSWRAGEEDGLRLWTPGGVPAAAWEGTGVRPSVRREPGLATRPLPVDEEDADPLG